MTQGETGETAYEAGLPRTSSAVSPRVIRYEAGFPHEYLAAYRPVARRYLTMAPSWYGV